MNSSNPSFIVELVRRFLADKPQFFKYIQYFALVLGAVSGIIDYLKSQDVVLPSWIGFLGSAVVWVSSIVATLIAQLPVSNPAEIKK